MNAIATFLSAPWMNDEEKEFARQFQDRVIALHPRVAESPFLALRVSDLAAMCILIRRMESALLDAPDPTAKELLALWNSAARTRAQMRKALGDLEKRLDSPSTESVPATALAAPAEPTSTKASAGPAPLPTAAASSQPNRVPQPPPPPPSPSLPSRPGHRTASSPLPTRPGPRCP